MLSMAWNLILAGIPYAISFMLLQIVTRKPDLIRLRWLVAVVFFMWLLFFPNAPYLITDLEHIHTFNTPHFIADVMIITSFAITGLIAALQSMNQMIQVLINTYTLVNSVFITCIRYGLWWLSALGIYLGRELRWNSWDLIDKPLLIVDDTASLFINPFQELNAWYFIIALGTFLSITQYVYSKFSSHETTV